MSLEDTSGKKSHVVTKRKGRNYGCIGFKPFDGGGVCFNVTEGWEDGIVLKEKFSDESKRRKSCTIRNDGTARMRVISSIATGS